MFDKNNSLSLVVPSKIAKETHNKFGTKKSPAYGKRNLSISNNRTFDERATDNFDTIEPLDFNTRMNMINQKHAAKLQGIKNHRYKLKSLMDQKCRSGSNRKKSSNSK